VELIRNVVHGWDFVSPGSLGEELAFWGENEFLEREEPQALHEGTLDLPNVHARIQTLAHVHHNVRPQNLTQSQRTLLNLDYGQIPQNVAGAYNVLTV